MHSTEESNINPTLKKKLCRSYLLPAADNTRSHTLYFHFRQVGRQRGAQTVDLRRVPYDGHPPGLECEQVATTLGLQTDK